MLFEDHEDEVKKAWDSAPLKSRPGFGFYPDYVWEALEKTTEYFLSQGKAEEGGINLSNFSIARKDEFRCGVLHEYWLKVFPKFDVENLEKIPCFPLWDGASCIPPTMEGDTAVFPCMQMYDGKFYSTQNNASRKCLSGGFWEDKTNYTLCDETESSPGPPDIEISIIVYFIGYSISLLALLCALCIFLSFREMRCMRHKIHIGLFLTYIFTDLAWIITSLLQNEVIENERVLVLILWCSFRTMLSYFHLATFFWMFLEGLYLFLQVQMPLSLANVKHKHFLIFGWGCPLLVIVLWGILRDNLPPLQPNHQSQGEAYNETDEGHEVFKCPFLEDHHVDFFAYKVPVLILLIFNTFFLVWIMVIVISKLRAQTVMEYDRKHWKAAKALIVVIPLLGFTYLLTLMGPDREANPTGYLVFQCIRAVLLSTQGFVITLPYCFMNSEVRGVLKTRWERWQLIRSVGGESMRTSMGCSTFFTHVDSRNGDRGRGKLLEVPLNHGGLYSYNSNNVSYTDIQSLDTRAAIL